MSTGERPAGRPRPPWRLVAQLAMVALAVHLVLPQLAGLEKTGRQLAFTTWWLPVVVLVLEAASLLAYGGLVLAVLRGQGQRAPVGLVQRATAAGNALGRSMPAGGAAAMAMTVHALGRSGLDPARATAGLATSGLLSSVVLACLLPVGLLLSLGAGTLGLTAVAVGVVVLIGAALAPLAARHPAGAGELVSGLVTRVTPSLLRRRLDPARVGAVVRRGLEGVAELTADRRTLATATAWAAANWLLDVAVLLVLALTIGRGTPLASILLVYVVAQLVSAVPITPGGVGVVEAVMVTALVTDGSPAASATATVLGWRLVSHWLPILVGLALLPTLRGTAPGKPRRARTPRRARGPQ